MRAVFFLLLFFTSFNLTAAENDQTVFESFTGSITRPKVRLRTASKMDAQVVRELSKGDLFVVDGEDQDFYTVKVPSDVKTYIYRGLVIDGVVEGQHVNVRLEPTTDAPIIAKLNTGDRVKGQVAPANHKWLEIEAPTSARFYIAKEYVERIGGPEHLAEVELRKKEVKTALKDAYSIGKEELDKPFELADQARITDAFNRVIEGYSEFTEEVKAAKEGLSLALDSYLQKKIQFLEEKAQGASSQSDDLDREVQAFQDRLAKLEKELKYDLVDATEITSEPSHSWTPAPKSGMSTWEPQEIRQYEDWKRRNLDGNLSDFYHEERVSARTLTGVIEAYSSPVKNKPGNYILRDSHTKLPIAYLYSTKVDLEGGVGQVATVKASPRPNNNFAFPAYHVLSIE